MTAILKYALQPWPYSARPLHLYEAANAALGVAINDGGRGTPLQANGANPPSFATDANGNRLARFDGANDQLTAGVAADWSFLAAAACTIFSVCRNPSGSSVLACTYNPAGNGFIWQASQTTSGFVSYTAGVAWLNMTWSQTPSDTTVIGLGVSGVAGGSAGGSGATIAPSKLWRNGDLVASRSTAPTYPANVPALPLTIGYNPITTTYWGGDLYVLGIDDRPWGAAQYAQAHSYWSGLLAGL